MATIPVTVTIEEFALGVFRATVDTDPINAQPGDVIDWDISEPSGFPPDSEVFLQFFKKNPNGKKSNTNGCLTGGNNGKHKGSSNGPKRQIIVGDVVAPPHSGKQSHFYLLAYTDPFGGGGVLLDPEIVVDGGQKKNMHAAAGRSAKTSGKSKKAAPKKKATVKKAAKKAKKAKKAPRAATKTAKRKAKKR